MDNYTATEHAYKNGYEQGCKDTAEKFFKELKSKKQYEYLASPFDDEEWCVSSFEINKLAKQFGVEIKE